MPEKSSDLDREYRECVRRLYSIAPSFQVVGASGYHPGLDNMRAFAAFLGNPHLSLRAVHVAGTNGKGSVAHMLASALACVRPGTSIGLYTSPHLVDFRERIKTVSIDGSGDGRCFSEIGKEDVVDFLRRAADFINERRPSFFEITTAMAFDYFHRRGVEMAVIETGLGGRLDSTNIIVPELSVITSIGLDHKNILGDTIEKIAAEKAGIIKPGVPVVAGDLPEEAMKIVAGRAEAAGSDLYRAGDLCGDCADAAEAAGQADLRSYCQVKNIRTVFTSLKVLGAGPVVKGSPIYGAVIHAARMTGLRGRWERLSTSPEMICDIGHNPEALAVSMRQLVEEAAGRHIIMVYGMASDKDVEAAVRFLPHGPSYVFTQAEGSRAMPSPELQRMAASAGIVDSMTSASVADAVKTALSTASSKDLIFIGGSSYVVAEAIQYWDGICDNKKVNP